MTTTEQLREYLDAHGIDGPPTEPGWYVVECEDRDIVVVLVERVPHGMAIRMGGEGGAGMFRTDCTRHAPLTLAPLAGRDLDAETVAGVQAARMVFALPDADLRVDVYQHRAGDNRTAEGVIVVHIPTGARAQCHEHRSRHKNKAAAMEDLKRAEAVRAFCRGEMLRDDLRGLAGKGAT